MPNLFIMVSDIAMGQIPILVQLLKRNIKSIVNARLTREYQPSEGMVSCSIHVQVIVQAVNFAESRVNPLTVPNVKICNSCTH